MDLVQDAFMKLWHMRDRIDPATVEALAFRIALNLASNRLRSRRLWRWLPFVAEGGDDIDPGALADAGVDARRRQRAVRAAVESLPDDLRRVVFMCEFSGLGYDEIASALGVPTGTVGSRRNRALKLLREKLEQQNVAEEVMGHGD
jgi:RNA polymerase sigma-70 factor (ECF subfamily)